MTNFVYKAKADSEPCQVYKMEHVAKIVNGFKRFLFSQNIPSYKFDRVLNTPEIRI